MHRQQAKSWASIPILQGSLEQGEHRARKCVQRSFLQNRAVLPVWIRSSRKELVLGYPQLRVSCCRRTYREHERTWQSFLQRDQGVRTGIRLVPQSFRTRIHSSNHQPGNLLWTRLWSWEGLGLSAQTLLLKQRQRPCASNVQSGLPVLLDGFLKQVRSNFKSRVSILVPQSCLNVLKVHSSGW